MYEARIEFVIGSISFIGEGEKEWVAQQLDKILDKSSTLINLPVVSISKNIEDTDVLETNTSEFGEISNLPLPKFLQQTGATTSQLKRFLATAVWLGAKGNKELTTTDVTRALKDSQQSKLSNPSDCLNKNVSKGFCEKTNNNGFFVTPIGKESLRL